MKRLFWKEWHELRWYLLACAVVPLVVLGLFEDYSQRGLFSAEVQMLMLILLFWGASRMREYAQSNRFTIHSLPESRLQVLAVKFLPGLIMAVLFTCWIRSAVLVKGLGLEDEPMDWLAYAVSLYMVSFAFSLFASTIASVLASWFVVWGGGAILQSLTHYGLRDDITHWSLAAAAFFTIMGICLIVRHADLRRRVAVVLISMMLAFPTGLIIENGARMDAISCDLTNIFAHPKEPDRPFDGSYADNAVRILVSQDRNSFAYAEGRGTVDEVKIRDAHGVRTILKRNAAAPMAWLPDGNLLIVASDTALDTQLLEWNHKSGVLSYLVRFPNNNENRRFDMPSIERAIPSPDGTKIALIKENEKRGYDLWMLDRRSRKLKLAHPGMSVDWYGNGGFSWDGDRLVFKRGSRFWSIRSDGSDLKRIPCS